MPSTAAMAPNDLRSSTARIVTSTDGSIARPAPETNVTVCEPSAAHRRPRHGGAGRAERYAPVVTNARSGLVVALDGPGSSGKSSVGAAAALRLGYRFCDTGLLYRAATFLALERGVRPSDTAALVALVLEIALVADANGRLAHVSVDGVDVTAEVHTPRVDDAVSAVSRVPELRAALLAFQRSL